MLVAHLCFFLLFFFLLSHSKRISLFTYCLIHTLIIIVACLSKIIILYSSYDLHVDHIYFQTLSRSEDHLHKIMFSKFSSHHCYPSYHKYLDRSACADG